MKTHFTLNLCMLLFLSCGVYQQELATSSSPQLSENGVYAQSEHLKPLLHELLDAGVPGIAVAIKTPEEEWQYAAGLAKIEDQISMSVTHLHYLQSIAKTYQAVAIMKLVEEEQLFLDSAISQYLPEEYRSIITRNDEITLRMLLNHTSGIPEYNDHAINITQLLQTPEKQFTTDEYFKVIDGKPLDFEPGSRYSYRNSNYELLSLIADEITGDHARHITELIFKPLGLKNTYYRHEPGYLSYPRIYNTYWDRYSDGILENVSQMQRTNVASMIGDDGIVSTPEDAVKFLEGLMLGKILSHKTLKLMEEGFIRVDGEADYGLGLDIANMADHRALGHSGGGLGAGCQLYYFPHNGTYFFIGINMGTITEGPIADRAAPLIDNIHQLLVN